MPRAGWTKPDTDHRLSDHLAFAMLTRVFPPEIIDRVLTDLGRVERRNRLLPARVVVYYVLGLALFSHSSYDEVIRLLMAGQAWSTGWTQTWPVPTKAALYKARLRLGPEPLQELFDRVAKPTATLESGTGFYRSWRVLGLDIISLDVPDTPANEEEFTRPEPIVEASAAFLKARVGALTELGTGAIVGAIIGEKGASDPTLTQSLLAQLDPESLVLAGADIYSPESWAIAAATGASVVWALPPDVKLPTGVHYSDGSYASQIAVTPGTPVTLGGSRDVRIIEAKPGREGEGYPPPRYVTTIVDPLLASASDLAGLFAKQRSLASAFDEFRAYHDSARIVLRSKVPDGVRQEIYGFLCVHYAMRRLMNTPPPGSEQASLTQP